MNINLQFSCSCTFLFIKYKINKCKIAFENRNFEFNTLEC